jgi:hypothetical protein
MAGEMATKFLIPFADFGRIHQTIYSIVKSEGADPLHSCFFFSMVGASILRQHYRIDASVSAGIAAYRLGGAKGQVLTFAEEIGEELHCTGNGFHAWVEAKGWLLDFMSPLFAQITDVPAKMLQKELSTGADTFGALVAPGDFLLDRDSEMEQSLLERFSSTRGNLDLLQIATDWYRRPPKRIKKTLEIFDQDGAVKKVRLTGVRPSGVW